MTYWKDEFRAYQEAKGLSPDGDFGPMTWAEVKDDREDLANCQKTAGDLIQQKAALERRVAALRGALSEPQPGPKKTAIAAVGLLLIGFAMGWVF